DVKKWFDEYHKVLRIFKIKHAKNVVNFDETGLRIGCAGSEEMIVPTDIMEFYKASLENRKSITVCEAIRANGSEPPPPFVIVPGQKVIKAWIAQELVGEERIRPTTTRYTNNEVALEYLDHLILHLQASPSKPWKILLLDSHESHKTDTF
ncbi:hypothetical protein NA56DRAFT_578193, partial [Hyaloscypha hepaticicola]